MKKSICVFVSGLLALLMTHAHAKDPDLKNGKAAFETCRGCHSIPGYSNAYPTFNVPKIGGQRADYLAAALQAYKDGARPHGTMKANAHDLSEQTIADIAAYVQANPGNVHSAPADGDPVKGKELAQGCVSCHTNNLKDGGNIPILAGQYGNYLFKAMRDYQSGKRNNPIMQSMLNGLSEDDLMDISSYFAYMKALSEVE